MTPAEHAHRHPHLFHLTCPEAVDGIRRHGLLPSLALLDFVEADTAMRAHVLTRGPVPFAARNLLGIRHPAVA